MTSPVPARGITTIASGSRFARARLATFVAFFLAGYMLYALISSAGQNDPATAGRNIGLVSTIGHSVMLLGLPSISVFASTPGLGRMNLFAAILVLGVSMIAPFTLKRTTIYSGEGEDLAVDTRQEGQDLVFRPG